MTETPRKQWYLHTKKADFAGIAKELDVDPILVRIMRNRDLLTAEEMKFFLTADRERMYPAGLLPNAVQAAERITEKIRDGKRIRIVGDYDIDGVCATYILYDGLRRAGAAVDYVIPERVRDGYGINIRIVEEAAEDGIDTLITCDNGISAVQELSRAKELGMTVILTDHHDIRKTEEGTECLPDADFIVSAKLAASKYPEKEICGAVTAWKLLQEIFRHCNVPEEVWFDYLEFAGIATVGDVMKLTGENRILAREALNGLNGRIVNRGLAALVRACGLEGKQIGCYHIGFVIGPCINAGGRLETAEKAMQLFLAEDDTEAERFAEELRELNESRKSLTAKGVENASVQVRERYQEDRILVVCLPDLHESMAGIVAGRIRETFGKPALVVTGSGVQAENTDRVLLKGSGRSIEAWNMFEGLQGAADLLVKFGGHPMAAGFSIYADDLEEFRRRLNENCGLTEEDLIEKVWIDMRLPLSCVSARLVRELEKLEPFGNGNEKPLFAEKNVRLTNLRVLGKTNRCLRMDAYTEDGYSCAALMFGDAEQLKTELLQRRSVDITFYPQINEYRGMETLQIVIEDYR